LKLIRSSTTIINLKCIPCWNLLLTEINILRFL
jgi:hypothetical protein